MSTIPDISVMEVKDYQPQIRKLTNGITTYTFPSKDSEVVYMKFVFYNAGSISQNKSLTATFTGSQIGKNTKDYTYKQLSEEMDFYGLYFSPYTSRERFCLNFSFLNRYQENILPLIQQIILYTRFDEHTLEVEVGRAKQNYLTKLQQTNFLGQKCFNQELFGQDNLYGKYATIEDYNNINIKDLQNFWQKYYTLNQCYIMLAGNVEEKFFDLLEAFFGKEKITEKIEETNINFGAKKTNGIIRNSLASAQQTSIVMGRLLPEIGNEDYILLIVLNCIFGGYFNSRLMSNIREQKGYTYGIDSAIIPFKYGNIMMIVSDIALDKEKQTIEEIHKEMDILKNDEVSLQELSTVKNYMTGEMLRSTDGVAYISENYDYILRYKLRKDYNSYLINGIRAITRRDIKNIARKYLNKESFLCSVVGK